MGHPILRLARTLALQMCILEGERPREPHRGQGKCLTQYVRNNNVMLSCDNIRLKCYRKTVLYLAVLGRSITAVP